MTLPTDPPRRVALLDTSVLFPISLMDLGLRLVERRIHDVRWSEDLLAESERVWDRERLAGRRVPSPGAATAALQGIRDTFPRQEVPRRAYQDRIGEMPGSDPDDRPHAAAALAGGATHLVTSDRSGGFPIGALQELGLAVVGPNECYAQLAIEYPRDVTAAVEAMARRRVRQHPGFTTCALIYRYEQQGLVQLSTVLR